ncbi:hypothetical protein ABFV74_07030 [Pseudoalteromonas distincta]|uniref:hypothetical protein n=1 Tax=Pseudoalteromonas distincta TaxID=77608 RepID=UPI003218A463
MSKSLKSIPPLIQEHLNTVGGYDDPCFILINAEKDITPFISAIDAAIDSEIEPDDIEYKRSVKATDNLYFILLYSEHEELLNMANKVLNVMSESEVVTHISVFRHNCLGEANETFLWSSLLLDETREEFGVNSGFKINDPQNMDTWPGLEKYRTAAWPQE